MKNTRKWLAVLLTIAMVLAMAMLATGCGEEPSNDDEDDDDDKSTKTSISTTVDGTTTTTSTEDGGATTTTGRDTTTQDTSALKEFVEENYDDLVELLSNGAPEEVEVEVKAKGNDIIVTFAWPMLDELSKEELDEVADSARTEMAPEWAPAFWTIREEVSNLASIQLEFYKSNGDYAFGAKVDEDTPYEDTEEPEDPENDMLLNADLLGKWEAEIDLTEQGEEDPMYYRFTFYDDGTVDIEMELGGESDTTKCEYGFEDGYLYIDNEAYEYTLEEDTLVLDYVTGAEDVTDEMIEALFPMECARVA